MPPDVDEEIRRIGNEYGATTARPRRCGWLDLVALRHATQINGLTHLALTKFDVLDHLNEILICTAYERNGQTVSSFPTSLSVLEECEPVYQAMPGWKQPLSQVRSPDELPTNAKKYITYVAEFLDVPVALISVGKERSETVVLEEHILT
jgi:adenylosuccinate synthase